MFQLWKSKMADNKKSELYDVISDAIDECARRSNSDYDGLLGSLPPWVPVPLKKEFEHVRNNLLDCYEEEGVKEFIQGRKELFKETGIRSVKFTPPEIDDKLDALIYIQSIVDLGEENGIKAYLGEGGFEVTRGIVLKEYQSKGGQKTAGIKKDEASDDYRNINHYASDYLSQNRAKREIASLIIGKTNFSKKKVYAALKTHDSGLWK